jgi:Na+/H+ antiporter NhaD/arsenite permease-like protein
VIAGAAVFAVTYVLIAGRRTRLLPLDRPAGALLGAVGCVVLRVLTPKQAIDAVNGETLVLLFGLMGMGAFLAEGGLLERASDWLVAKTRSPARLLGALVWGAGLLSPLITNDAVCVLAAPVVVTWIQKHKLPALPFLLGLATAANTGSVATLVGNPQNMLCGTLGDLEYRSYLAHMAPVALVGLAINHAMLALIFKRELATVTLPKMDTPRVLDSKGGITLIVIALTVGAYLSGTDLAWTAVAGFTSLMLVHRADPTKFWGRIDWSILLFFGGLFVVVAGLVQSGAAGFALAHVPIWTGGWARTAGLFLIGSNVVSNVPFILVVSGEMKKMPNPTLAWELLAMASTFAGNLTLLGSVANVIVAERGRAVGGLGFVQYLKVGFPLALITTAVGTAWLLAVHHI